tara:strand:+ start:90 stop:221 length:132 start_codon:yes stop_codon:yes gene_type:complete
VEPKEPKIIGEEKVVRVLYKVLYLLKVEVVVVDQGMQLVIQPI